MGETTLHLELDAFDLADLQSYLDGSLLKLDQTKPEDAFGEPVTIAVIIIAPIAIKALAAWLTKQRKKGETVLETEITHPDGSRERRRLRIKRSSSTTEADVLQQLKDGLQLDPQLVKAAAELGK